LKTRLIAARIFDALMRHHPNPDTELRYRTPFELLVATILSAQSTDQRVNEVTPALFAKFPDAQALARADLTELETMIKSTGFFRQKSKALVGMAQALVERHGGEVPADMESLTRLPGVGRKTANVVLGHALGVPGLPVDRHVLRVANRIGLVHSDDPERVEQVLCALYPPERWTNISDLLILHGRRICRPTPRCEICNVRKDCDYFMRGGAAAGAARTRASSRSAKARSTARTVRAPVVEPVARSRNPGRSASSSNRRPAGVSPATSRARTTNLASRRKTKK
jgi:endonuclease-3